VFFCWHYYEFLNDIGPTFVHLLSVCHLNKSSSVVAWCIMQGVAITQENSLLDNTARIEGWLARFPMFDWVGGRTSEMSAVGLLPAALQVIGPKQ